MSFSDSVMVTVMVTMMMMYPEKQEGKIKSGEERQRKTQGQERGQDGKV